MMPTSEPPRGAADEHAAHDLAVDLVGIVVRAERVATQAKFGSIVGFTESGDRSSLRLTVGIPCSYTPSRRTSRAAALGPVAV